MGVIPPAPAALPGRRRDHDRRRFRKQQLKGPAAGAVQKPTPCAPRRGNAGLHAQPLNDEFHLFNVLRFVDDFRI